MEHPQNKALVLNIPSNAPQAYYLFDGEHLVKCGDRLYKVNRREFVF
jgi:hypothetical protein